jgi:uncharacterized protein YabN with tetrapyrrole methylase and pyrophosphatase domain
MNARTELPCDIAIVGLGISGVHQLTPEAKETISRCRHAFVAGSGDGVAEYLETLCPDVVDVAAAGTDEHRIITYRRAASQVVVAALSDAPVCFATYGHPTMLCYPTTLIQRAAVVLDLKVQIVAGVSFLDTLLSDLGIDPGFDGLQLYEATDLLIRRRPLQNDVACVITQAPTVADPYNRPGARDLTHLTLLQDHILQFYPADHEVILVTSKPHPLLDPLIQPVALGSLAAALMPAIQIGTLYIPPLRHREIVEEALAERMRVPQSPYQVPASRPGRPTIGPQPG